MAQRSFGCLVPYSKFVLAFFCLHQDVKITQSMWSSFFFEVNIIHDRYTHNSTHFGDGLHDVLPGLLWILLWIFFPSSIVEIKSAY